MSLSPWDLSGLGMSFGLYRPRRPSYTYATQQRQRTESYRYAVRKSASEPDEPPDFIEGIIQQKNRKESYVRATRQDEPYILNLPDNDSDQMDNTKCDSTGYGNHTQFAGPSSVAIDPATSFVKYRSDNLDNHIQELKSVVAKKRVPSPRLPTKMEQSDSSFINSCSYPPSSNNHSNMKLAFTDLDEGGKDDNVFTPSTQRTFQGGEDVVRTPCSEDSVTGRALHIFTYKKNLILLCASFILMFSAFRAIQNLQSSINNQDNLGIITMSCVHGTMFFTCVLAPVIINKLTAKWALVSGMTSFLCWIAANFYSRFYTLIPFGILAGLGQGILWTAESSYILKLAFDTSRVSKEGLEKEAFRFHGIFLACFQTTHIWGNLISSLIFHSARKVAMAAASATVDDYDNNTYHQEDGPVSCGGYYIPQTIKPFAPPEEYPGALWKLMTVYLVLGGISFCLILFCLDKIGAKVEPEKTGYQIVIDHVTMLLSNKSFRLLIPLLIFNGLQQGFVFADFNQAYVTCAMRSVEYIGYAMIILGLANVISAIFVAVCARLIPREVVFGVGGVLHMGLMIGFLIWMPEKNLSVFFILAAAWGVCDAVWQTQCNTLICITCVEDTDIAFANYRLLQSFGLTVAFVNGLFLSVSFKLYILMILLVVAIMFYVLAEYRVRQEESGTLGSVDT
ncbi:hypothetical protein CHS0354_018042 [Potamilus streckersoni]|uniref:Protein unc-93 homolog A n=1 Tax=Potamilus streckersoni TaxID=2493646 RepID=A0AAE0RN06_9BIVA|nr:hypothetical protein CHS0354_018042 [Potamilus streckersoni]